VPRSVKVPESLVYSVNVLNNDEGKSGQMVFNVMEVEPLFSFRGGYIAFNLLA
jgi:hypothetical protein